MLRARTNLARREAPSAISASPAATGTATYSDWSSLTPFRYCERAMATGIASTANSPKKTATRAAPRLLLDIRSAGGGRPDRAPDHAGDGDQRQQVRQCLEERAPLVAVGGRQAVGERAREPEEQGGRVRREGPPFAEHERGEPDEAGACRHVLVERVHEAHREDVPPPHPRSPPGRNPGILATLVEGDADGAAARGCSPTERRRKPYGVRKTKMYVAIRSTNDSQIIRFSCPKIGPMKYQSCRKCRCTSGMP